MAEIVSDRRNLLARGLELASTIPLCALAVNNFGHRRSYTGLDSTHATILERDTFQVEKLNSLHAGYLDALGELQSAYHSQYYVLTYSFSAKKFKHKWKEEAAVPNHDVIDGWKNQLDHYARLTQRLVDGVFIDVSNLEGLKIETYQTNSIGQGALNILVYGAAITGLLGYEEIAGLDQDNSKNDLNGLVSRRSLFKVGAAAAATAGAAAVSKVLNNRLEQGRGRISKEIGKSFEYDKISPEAALNGHLGQDYRYIIRSVAEERGEMAQALSRGIQNDTVRSAFQSAVYHADQFISHHQSFFGDGVPQSLGKLCASAIITDRLNTARGTESALGNGGLLLEGLCVGALMTAVIVPLEIYNERVALKD